MSQSAQQFIYTLRLQRPAILAEGPTDAEAAVLQQHAGYLANLARQGDVLLAGRTQVSTPETFGIVILNTSDQTAAEAMMRNDPAVKHSVMQAELFPYQIAVLSEQIVDAGPADD